MATVASETFTATSAPIQYAAIKAFKGGIEIERYLRNARKILKTLGYEIHRVLASAGIECPKPDGAFYLFPNFRNYSEKLRAKNINTGIELTTKLLEETGVALLPGKVSEDLLMSILRGLLTLILMVQEHWQLQKLLGLKTCCQKNLLTLIALIYWGAPKHLLTG
jgi:hypothetical protein